MRWPFGPPHLTLKPSKQKTKQKPQKKKQKRNKEGLGPSEVTKKQKKKKKKRKERKRTAKNTRIPQKITFQLSLTFSFFGGGVQKLPFLTTWPKKRAPPKHYKNRGFRNPFCAKKFWVTKRPFRTKKNKSRNSSYLFFCLFLLLQQQKH